MMRTSKTRTVIVAALAAAAAIIWLGTGRVPALVISAPGGRVLATVDLPDGMFDHVFIHSVHHSPVVERFKVEREEGRIVLKLYQLLYKNEGVGMPSDAEGGYRLENGTYILTMNRTFTSIPVFVSVIPGHGILANGAFLSFRDWAKPEELLVLTGSMRPRLGLGR